MSLSCARLSSKEGSQARRQAGRYRRSSRSTSVCVWPIYSSPLESRRW
jgi:hypothetical protein